MERASFMYSTPMNFHTADLHFVFDACEPSVLLYLGQTTDGIHEIYIKIVKINCDLRNMDIMNIFVVSILWY